MLAAMDGRQERNSVTITTLQYIISHNYEHAKSAGRSLSVYEDLRQCERKI
jgi:hypothetical protein